MSDDHYQFTAPPKQWEKLKPVARSMRHESTHAESVLWQRIRGRRLNGAKFRRQHAIEGFVVDFVCIESRLIVEVDGSIHEEPDRQALDHIRQSCLEGCGFRILRFTNTEVLISLELVAEAICAALNATSPPQSPSP